MMVLKKLARIFKKLHTDNEVLSLVGNVSLSLFGLLNFMLLTRMLPKTDFGEYTLFIATTALIEMFRFGFTHSSLIKFLPGANETDQKSLIGSNYLLGLFLAIFFSAVVFSCSILFAKPIESSGYKLFFVWYPLLNIISFPFNNSFTILQARSDFKKILFLRLVNGLGFLSYLVVSFLLDRALILKEVILVQILLSSFNSVLSTIKRWDGFRYIKYFSRASILQLFHFGKYATFSFIGTNLLRSADTYLISFSIFGINGVAVYAIPMKLNELLQIPLRSFSSTLYPTLSKASNTGDHKEFRYLFYSRTGFLTILFIPLVIAGLLFSDLFVLVLAGKEYLTVDPVVGVSASALFKVFVLYGILMPVDRFTGIALDAINKPRLNSIKIGLMLVANVIGDIIALWVFKSILLVAATSILFMLIGAMAGFMLISKEISLDPKYILIHGWAAVKAKFNIWRELKR